MEKRYLMLDFRRAFGAGVAVAMLSGCGGGSTPTTSGCNNQAPPFVQLLYPIPGSKDVKPTLGVLILAGNEHQLPWLTAGGKFRFYGKLMPLPSPLPQPELTPAPGASLYAASLRTLAQRTRYGVSVSLTMTYCDGGIAYPKKLGSFTTQSK